MKNIIKNVKESYIESQCVKIAKEKGYHSYKMNFIGQKGCPDRLFVGKKSFFVEFKRPEGGKLTEIQKYQQNIFKKAGIEVYNINDINDFKLIFVI